MKSGIKIKQKDLSDCGAACLASVAAYYQLQLPLSRIRQLAGTDQRGTSIAGLLEAAEKLGFQAKAAKGNIENLSGIPLPAIAHVILENNLHHYFVIYTIKSGLIRYLDPADGEIHKISTAKFAEIWNGIILLLIPGISFKPGNEKVSVLDRFLRLAHPHRNILFQLFIGAVLYTLLGLSTTFYLQKIVDFVWKNGNANLLNILSITMIVLLLFQMSISYFKNYLALQTGKMIDTRLVMGYYRHLLKLPQRFFDTMQVGEIMSRINDAVKIRLFINDIALGLLVNLLVIVCSFLLMLFINWKLALLVTGILPVYLISFWLNNRLNKKWNRRIMEEAASLESQLIESINTVTIIKRFNLVPSAIEKTGLRFYKLLNSIHFSGTYTLWFSLFSEFITRLVTILLLWSGSYYVLNNSLSPGELLSFYALTGNFTGPAAALSGASKSIQDALIAAERLFEIIDLESEDGNQQLYNLAPKAVGDISFSNVSFRYGARKPVIHNLCMTIRKGSFTAIVGESGSGKSTLIALLHQLYPIKEGKISIGEMDIRLLQLKCLRQRIAVVPQHTDLFSATIIENIAPGITNPDMKRIVSICKMLGMEEFIEELPGSYFCVLSERGVNLSGGQKQRVAIARALYADPEIILLDEATANLDPQSEKKVMTALKWFNEQGKTIIIITHRLASISSCKTINVLSKGRLAESGSHEELLNNKGEYFSLWNTQTAGAA